MKRHTTSRWPAAFLIPALLLLEGTLYAQAATQKTLPLFPRHRRGLYINKDKIEVIDATPQSPPLDIDDPGVPDKGAYEINLLTEADLGTHAHTINVLTVDANYGIVLKGWGHELPTQVKFEYPVVAREEQGNPYEIGIGTSAFGLKFNFYNNESNGLRVAVYPQIEFSLAGSVKKGVAETGQTFVLPVLVMHEFKYVTMVGNAGVTTPFNDRERQATAEMGFGIGSAIFRKIAVMGDIRGSSALNLRSGRLVSVNAGVIYGVRKAIWYARVGHSVVSVDGTHVFFNVGVKLMIP